jgi:hypothetical protein
MIQLLVCASLIVSTDAAVTGLQVTLRGKKYEIPQDVQTVRELQTAVGVASGLSQTDMEQQSVLYEGKRLEPSSILKDVGVIDGASLSMVPASAATSGKKKRSTTSTVASTSTTTSTESSSSSTTNNNMDAMMKDYLAKSGIDPAQVDEMLASMGGGGGDNAGSMQEAMSAMSSMMQSPIFKEYMSDPEKLEQSRQMILSNPMLKSMMAGMPGMEELLKDKEAWRQAMMAAASLYQNMDQDELMKGIMGGLSGAPPPTGMFDGMLDPSSSTAAAALEELDEDD